MRALSTVEFEAFTDYMADFAAGDLDAEFT